MSDYRVYERDYNIRIAALGKPGVDIKGLRASFSVKRTAKPKPNTCSLEVWNMNPDNIRDLTAAKKVEVAIYAGYKDGISQIYLGETRHALPQRDGPDVVLSMSSGDGEKEIQKARLVVPVGPTTPANVVLPNIAKALTAQGIKVGNLSAAAAKLAAKQAVIFPVPSVIDGNAWAALVDFCAAADLECSIQSGALQILPRGEALDERAYILSSATGLEGYPTVDYDGTVNFTCKMLPGIRPCVRVQMEAEFVKGLYRIEECTYTGDTHGDDWKIDCVAKKSKVGA